jgi:hypothetical protein
LEEAEPAQEFLEFCCVRSQEGPSRFTYLREHPGVPTKELYLGQFGLLDSTVYVL